MQDTCQPALVTLQRHAARADARSLDGFMRVLAPQPPERQPGPQGWAVLPAANGPLAVDFTGQGMIGTAMLLTDLRSWIHAQPYTPLLLVPSQALALQRLIAAAHLPAIVVSAEQPDRAWDWLAAPLQVDPAPVWVGLPPPEPPATTVAFVDLFAALSRADTVAQAAAWSALSARRAYRVLAASAQRLAIPAAPWRIPSQWVRALARGLTRRDPNPLPHPSSEVAMDFHGLDVIAATLCGCRIERLTRCHTTLILDLVEPRQGALICTCADARILDDPAMIADLPMRPAYARTIDWVDVLPDQSLLICFPDQTSLRVQLRTAQFARAHAG
jgi:hypothetical protein